MVSGLKLTVMATSTPTGLSRSTTSRNRLWPMPLRHASAKSRTSALACSRKPPSSTRTNRPTSGTRWRCGFGRPSFQSTSSCRWVFASTRTATAPRTSSICTTSGERQGKAYAMGGAASPSTGRSCVGIRWLTPARLSLMCWIAGTSSPSSAWAPRATARATTSLRPRTGVWRSRSRSLGGGKRSWWTNGSARSRAARALAASSSWTRTALAVASSTASGTPSNLVMPRGNMILVGSCLVQVN
mmetsp:Transcript_66366/g.148967  ORF Transcript_66366/g.148967 Transcript_66366/m.148967 type:complete len:243 (-) Transcript_66366:32-760(-)